MNVVDDALERLRRIGGEKLVRKMIASFSSNAARRVDDARAALEDRDYATLERAAHSLKSSAGNVGATELARQAAEIEQLAAGGGSGRLGELVGRLPEMLRVVGARLEGGAGMKRIAVVEDNPDNRLLVYAILEDRYSVLEYESGVEALPGILADAPDLVLLDISLPGMDGTDVLARLRADPRTAKLPMVALTAHAMAGDREKYLAAGFDDYISKPIVDEDILLDVIARLLR